MCSEAAVRAGGTREDQDHGKGVGFKLHIAAVWVGFFLWAKFSERKKIKKITRCNLTALAYNLRKKMSQKFNKQE